MRIKTREKDVVKAVKDYLTLRGLMVIRMQVGSFPVGDGDSKRYFRTGTKGMADLLAFTPTGAVIWCECKSNTGKMSDAQEIFKSKVERMGHIYILARSLDDVLPLFENRRG